MTKTKAQKARAKQPKQQAQPPKTKKRNRKARGPRNPDRMFGGGDQSQTRGGNGGEIVQRTPTRKAKVLEKVELIQLVNGSVGFNALRFPLNPGLAGTLPIGATEAANYTDWKMKYMRVDYIPTVSPFATQGQKGEVVIAVDYNADNALPTAMNQVEDMDPAGGGIPSKGFTFWVNPKLANKADPKYIRKGAVPAGDDLRLYDGGNLYFATAGCTDGTQIGKLMVSYHFELTLPNLLNEGATGLAATNAGAFQGLSEAGGATGVAYQQLLATSLASPLFVNTVGSIVPPAGNYAVTASSRTVFTGLATQVVLSVLKNGVAASFNATAAFTSGSLTTVSLAQTLVVTCNGTDAITLTTSSTYTTGTNTVSADLVMVPI